jgi:uncharacterized protein
MNSTTLPPEHRATLLRIARESLFHGLREHAPKPVEPHDYAPELCRLAATFVTLRRGEELQGCIGTLRAIDPMVTSVSRHAYAAGFEDPRGTPLTENGIAALKIHISLLSDPQSIAFTSEVDLLRQVRPGIDGLIIEEGSMRGTLLPSVWENLPKPKDFVNHVKVKAGLPEYYWSPTVKFLRYTTELID